MFRSGAAQHMPKLQPLKTIAPRGRLALENKQAEGGERRFNSWILQGLWWEQSEMETRERERASRASSSPGRKEEFPLASDCLTCKNVAFVAGPHSSLSLFFLFFFGRLSVTSCLLFLLFLFLCSSVTSRVSYQHSFFGFCTATATADKLRLLIGFPYVAHIVKLSLIPVQCFPINFNVKVPRCVCVGGGSGK